MSRLDHLLTMGALRDPSRPFLLGAESWSYAKADEEVNERAARFRRLSSGLPVCVRAVNSASWVLNLLALLRANIPAILIPNELTEREMKALIQVAGTQYRLDGDRWEATGLKPGSVPEWLGQDVAVGFTTSGSTGEPRIALRSHASLTDEGQRYQLLWKATPDDVFLAPAPLYHAYTFGAALAAALTAGATLAPVIFKSPQVISRQIQQFGATIVPLVPAMARILALVDQGKPVQSKLRVVMAGAGQITDEISNLFSLRWGVGLSRNYGSSETGAILATLNPAAGNVTGDPMPGICCELVENFGQPGSQLWVRLKHPPAGYLGSNGYESIQISPGGWWPMGDVFERDGNGGLRLIGRRGSSIRRGGHSIQPREIEAILLSSPAVAEAYVRGLLDRHGEECVEAHVALKEPGSVTAEDLDRFLRTKLASYKVPNKWHFYDKLPKTWTSKISTQLLDSDEPAHYATLFQAVQGFRLSNAIFAAEQLGIIRELNGEPQPLSAIAGKLSCDAQALGFLLDYLKFRGIVTGSAAGYRLTRKSDPAWTSICSLEEQLSATWLSAQEIMDVVRNGLQDRPFDQQKEAGSFSNLYIEAFCAPWQDYVALLLQRQLRLPREGEGLEVGRAAGRIALYLRRALQMNCQFRSLGPGPNLGWRGLPEPDRLQTYGWEELPLLPNSLDVIVLTNVIHWLQPKEARPVLRRMLEALRPAGALAVVDIFVDAAPESSQFLLDWLTHGGVHLTRIRDLKGHLDEAGFAHVDSEAIRETPVQLITCRSLAAQTQTDNLTLTEKKK
jgi:long-chain acyl-CoA synthetase